ncbi:MAG: 3-isopropylmalate dehydrogenase [Ignavibacteriales bacterium]|nr:3-isopropylmalate dehydrogenase [Ignavibacteriales bacterium]
MNINITLLPGDGIGTEIVSSAVKVIEKISEIFKIKINFTEELFGGCSYDKYGVPLTEKTIESCKKSDAVLLGAVGGYKWDNLEHSKKPEAGLLKLRSSLGLFTNIRPAKVYNELLDASSLKSEILKGTDFIVLRELTGGIYFGKPRGYDDTKGYNTMIYTKEEVERIARQAFTIARGRKKRVTNVDKANVLECSQFWRKVVSEVHKDFQDVELQNMYVDNAAMQIVRNPTQFDVILTGNLFGDILSDISGMITGSLGMLPSASIGEKYALYEPIHGSAPDIAGKNKANPLATISSLAMMFELTFKRKDISDVIENSIKKTLAEGYRTADIFSEGTILVTTTGMTDQILNDLIVQ